MAIIATKFNSIYNPGPPPTNCPVQFTIPPDPPILDGYWVSVQVVFSLPIPDIQISDSLSSAITLIPFTGAPGSPTTPFGLWTANFQLAAPPGLMGYQVLVTAPTEAGLLQVNVIISDNELFPNTYEEGPIQYVQNWHWVPSDPLYVGGGGIPVEVADSFVVVVAHSPVPGLAPPPIGPGPGLVSMTLEALDLPPDTTLLSLGVTMSGPFFIFNYDFQAMIVLQFSKPGIYWPKFRWVGITGMGLVNPGISTLDCWTIVMAQRAVQVRPPTAVIQYGAYPGLSTNFTVPQNTITVFLPYLPTIGSLIIVGIAVDTRNSPPSYPTSGVMFLRCDDAHGLAANTYVQVAQDLGTHAQRTTAFYTGRVGQLPTAGPYGVTVLLDFTNSPISTNNAIGAFIMEIPTAGDYVDVAYSTGTVTNVGGGFYKYETDPLLIAANHYAIAVHDISSGQSGTTPFPYLWNYLDGYQQSGSLQTEWLAPFVPGNRQVLALGQMMYKNITVLGSYTASIEAQSPDGAILMISVEDIPVGFTAACPLINQIQVGTFYSSQITVVGGTPPFTFVLTGGSLPPGLTLDTSTGTISGTPLIVGHYDYSVTITDSTSTVVVIDCSFDITPIAPGVCIIVPVTTGTPSLTTQNEPLELEGT